MAEEEDKEYNGLASDALAAFVKSVSPAALLIDHWLAARHHGNPAGIPRCRGLCH